MSFTRVQEIPVIYRTPHATLQSAKISFYPRIFSTLQGGIPATASNEIANSRLSPQERGICPEAGSSQTEFLPCLPYSLQEQRTARVITGTCDVGHTVRNLPKLDLRRPRGYLDRQGTGPQDLVESCRFCLTFGRRAYRSFFRRLVRHRAGTMSVFLKFVPLKRRAPASEFGESIRRSSHRNSSPAARPCSKSFGKAGCRTEAQHDRDTYA